MARASGPGWPVFDAITHAKYDENTHRMHAGGTSVTGTWCVCVYIHTCNRVHGLDHTREEARSRESGSGIDHGTFVRDTGRVTCVHA